MLTDRKQVLQAMAHAMINDAVFYMQEEVGCDYLEDDVIDLPAVVMGEAITWLKEIEEHNNCSIEDIIEKLDADYEIDELGYYCAMQYMGSGVAWSDSREGELHTPTGESSEMAMDFVYQQLTLEDKRWHGVKELINESALIECVGTDWELIVHNGLQNTVSQSQAKELLDRVTDVDDKPLITIKDWR